MKVVAFNASPRKDGNTAILLGHVLAELDRAGIDTELVQLAGKRITGCTACLTCADVGDQHCHGVKDDGVNECIDRMVAADGIILGSPTYYANCTATAQALMERAGYATRKSGSNPLAGKAGAAVVAVRRAGAMHALDSLNHWFLINEMVLVGSTYWNIAIGQEAGAVSGDDEGVQTMKDLGRAMAATLARLRG
jgi:multimeric flavodoxin WrbA